MASRIFISYRRKEKSAVAGRLSDYLKKYYPEDSIFLDVDNIPPGKDFRTHIDEQVSQCQACLVMMGEDWARVTDKEGRRRLDNPEDYVRVEVASALKREIPVIPVLIDGAEMPAEEALPKDIKPLVFRSACELRNSRFNADAEDIALALSKWAPPPPKTPVALGAVLALVVAAAAGWYALQAPTGPAPQAVPLPALQVKPSDAVILLHANHSFEGNAYQIEEKTTFAACSAKCIEDKGCLGIEFYRSNTSCGLFKSPIPNMLPNPDVDVGTRIASSEQGGDAMRALEKRYVDGHGYDVTFGSTPQACAVRCTADSSCKMMEFYIPEVRCNLFQHTTTLDNPEGNSDVRVR